MTQCACCSEPSETDLCGKCEVTIEKYWCENPIQVAAYAARGIVQIETAHVLRAASHQSEYIVWCLRHGRTP